MEYFTEAFILVTACWVIPFLGAALLIFGRNISDAHGEIEIEKLIGGAFVTYIIGVPALSALLGVIY